MDDRQQSKRITDEIIHTRLGDGTRVCLRSIRPTDEARMRQGIEQLSSQSRYLRFFSPQPMPSRAVIERLIDADGHDHIAWGAILTDGTEHPAIGAVHAVRGEAPDETAEFSVAIVDAWHGRGLARMLIAVLLVNCRIERIDTLHAQVLSENRAAQSLIMSLGAQRCGAEYSVTEFVLDTAVALETLRAETEVPGLNAVFAALASYV